MTQPLFDDLVSIAQRIMAARQLLVGLDYDGTLTPIVDDPSQALLDSEVRNLLRLVAALPETFVAVVSGRRLLDVQNLVGVDELIYAGNHGLEIAAPGFRFIEPAAVEKRRALAWLARTLEKGLASVAGAVVENKQLTIAVHFRQASASAKKEIFRHVQAAAAVMPKSFAVYCPLLGGLKPSPLGEGFSRSSS